MKEKEEAEEKNGNNEATIPENLKQEFRRTLCLLDL